MANVTRVSWNWSYKLSSGGYSPILRYSAWIQEVPNFGWSLCEDYGNQGDVCVVSACYTKETAQQALDGVAEHYQRWPYTDPWYDVKIETEEPK